jgi:hypothetical protein
MGCRFRSETLCSLSAHHRGFPARRANKATAPPLKAREAAIAHDRDANLGAGFANRRHDVSFGTELSPALWDMVELVFALGGTSLDHFTRRLPTSTSALGQHAEHYC